MSQEPDRTRSWLSLLSLLWITIFVPHPGHAQMQRDASRPFEMGEPILLPATSLFLGDLPYSLQVWRPQEPLRTISEEFSLHPGWAPIGDPSAPLPGLGFDGILNPFGASAMAWLSVPYVEVQEFSGAAWWGPGSEGGSLQIQPSVLPKDKGVLHIAGGEGPWGGLAFQARPGDLSLSGRFRAAGSGKVMGSALGALEWDPSEGARSRTSFLLAKEDKDYWAVLDPVLDLGTGPFQTIRIRPFLQAAGSSSGEVRQEGISAHYLFDMGGFAQAQLGGGYSVLRSLSGVPFPMRELGYLQGGFHGDVLGMAAMDLSVRQDLIGAHPLDLLLGFQVTQDDLQWRGDLSNGEGGIFEAGIGFMMQSGDHLLFRLRVFERDVPGEPRQGGQALLRWRGDRSSIPFFIRYGLDLEERTQVDPGGKFHWDTGFRVELSLFGPERLWAQGRVYSGGPFPLWGGLDLTVQEGWAFFMVLRDMTGETLPWPEPEPAGRRNLLLGSSVEF